MAAMLSWLLGGNSSKLEGRPLGCRFSDKDHDALEEAMGGQWYLFPTVEGNSNTLQPIRLIRDEQRSLSLGSRSDPNDSASSLYMLVALLSEASTYNDS
ncbi:zeaxanthin epoxidase, chloroplastic-like isoform X6 [Miscanthus floridulus]|uniref:zeaxanthin epoxidase, chloroplastic-like isoform X6 n=1 Tax=Miscanthus floridulus TaxID=154761 RepID=UPI00345958C0